MGCCGKVKQFAETLKVVTKHRAKTGKWTNSNLVKPRFRSLLWLLAPKVNGFNFQNRLSSKNENKNRFCK